MKTHSKLDETKIIFSKSNMKSIIEYYIDKIESCDKRLEKNETYDKILNLMSDSLKMKLIRNFDNETKFNEILETDINNNFYLTDIFNILTNVKTQEEIKPKNVEMNISSNSNSISTTKIQQESTSINKIEILGNVAPGSRIFAGNNNISN